jgi:hypothetical protein
METNTKMTRLSATATIAALLLLAIAQGFGATSPTKSTVKSSPKIASKSTAKPYHITAQNQFHFKSAKNVKNMSKAPALARVLSKEQEHQQRLAQLRAQRHLSARPNALAELGRNAAQRTPAPRRATRARKQAANPPTGKIGFVSATQIPTISVGFPGETQAGAIGTSAAFITILYTEAVSPNTYVYTEVTANGDGTFNTLPVSPATPTPTACACYPDAWVVGDVNGDGNTDIIEVSNGGTTFNVLLSNGDGTFTAAAAGVGPASPFTLTLPAGATSLTGGTGVLNATTGFIDLVVIDNNAPSDLITYAGNGDGTFGTGAGPAITPVATPVTLSLPAGSTLDGVGFDAMITDFDGDGTVDVAENDYSNGELVVYESSASTPYQGVAVTTPDGNYNECEQPAFGSVTGSSGLPAIVEVNCGNDTITLYNNSSGAFSEGVYYPVVVTSTSYGDPYPEAATIADVNGDGNGDVVVTNDDGSDVAVLLSNGSGGLASATVGYATGGYPRTPAIVMDLNGDGLADILVSDDETGLVWMAGFGDGTFQAGRDYYSPIPDNSDEASSYNVASGDFNGDGFVDLVVSSSGCCDSTMGITVFLSNPDGSLQPGVNYGTGGTLENVAVADFNNDGNLDIAALNEGGAVEMFSGTGSGSFIQGPTYSVACCGVGIVGGAFNLPKGTTNPNGTGVTGFPDIAVVADTTITLLLNDGTGGFVASPLPALNSGGFQLAAANLTSSGFLDLVVSEPGGNNAGVLLGNGDGTFKTEADFPVFGTDFSTNYGPYTITVADVSGDGNADIVATDDYNNVLVATGNGDGTFNTTVSLAASLNETLDSPDPWSVQVTDVDGDGVADIVYVNSEYGTVSVLFGQGTGTATAPTFFDPVEFPTGGFPEGLTMANIDGDGTSSAGVAPDDFAGASTLINANGTGAAPNYTLTSNASFINIADGGTGTVTITLTPVNFYSGTVTFSCGGLPLDVTCAFAPATLTPLGNAPLQTTLTVTTAAPHGALRMPADANPHQGRTSLLACLTGMGLFGLLLSGDWKNKRNRRVGILLGILVLGMMFSLVGCSSSTTPGTPIGAQTVQVTGTGSDGTTNSVNVTINVF